MLVSQQYISTEKYNSYLKLVEHLPKILTDDNIDILDKHLNKFPPLQKILKDNSFFDTLEQVILRKVLVGPGNNFSEANSRSKLLVIYFKYASLTPRVANKIIDVLSSPAHPFDVGARLGEIILCGDKKFGINRLDFIRMILETAERSRAIKKYYTAVSNMISDYREYGVKCFK